MCGSLPGFGVFPCLSLIQRAGGSSKECVCVCVVCAVRVHTRAMCRGEGKLGCRSGMSPRRGVEEGHAQIKKSRKQLCQVAVPEQTVQLIS